LDGWKTAFHGNWSQQQANNNGVEFAGFFDGKHDGRRVLLNYKTNLTPALRSS